MAQIPAGVESLKVMAEKKDEEILAAITAKDGNRSVMLTANLFMVVISLFAKLFTHL